MGLNAKPNSAFKLRAINLHSHYSTRTGFLWRSDESIAIAGQKYKLQDSYKTEKEMAEDMRAAGVKATCDFGFTAEEPLSHIRKLHDFAASFRKDYPEVFLGGWLSLDPRNATESLTEFERCLTTFGMIGLGIDAVILGIPPSDKVSYPFYEMCVEAKVPVSIGVGYSGWGEGVPGGNGTVLRMCHPQHVDEIAARFPALTVVASRPGRPWQAEMIAILLHKKNVWCELHGWLAKYLSFQLKHEIRHRLQDNVMFGSNYPMFQYGKLFQAWESEGYSPELLNKLFRQNAVNMFDGLRHKIAWELSVI